MNIPGIFKIEKISFDSVSLPMLLSGQTINIDDYISDVLTSIDFITDTSGIEILNKKNDAGEYFDIEIPFKISGYDDSILADLKTTAGKPHVYVVTEKSGLKYLIGFDYDPKATFEYKLINDPDGRGGRSAECKINWKTTNFPIFISAETGGGGLPD